MIPQGTKDWCIAEAVAVLAKRLHACRDEMYGLPPTPWADVDPVMRRTYEEHADHAIRLALVHLQPLTERQPLRLVETKTRESRSPDGDGHEAGEASPPGGTLSAGRVARSTNALRGNTEEKSAWPSNRRNGAVKRTAMAIAEIDGSTAGSEPADSLPITRLVETKEQS